MSKTLIRAAGLTWVIVVAVATLPEAPIAAALAAQPQTAAAGAPGSRSVLQQYCVGCHNDRLKSGELSLAAVDPNDVSTHGPVLEKVVRKLRGGTMPPEGRPRPDKAAMNAFITSIETSLDRAAALRPNPGRVASRRLNRPNT